MTVWDISETLKKIMHDKRFFTMPILNIVHQQQLFTVYDLLFLHRKWTYLCEEYQN
jgi:hypothetical protein